MKALDEKAELILLYFIRKNPKHTLHFINLLGKLMQQAVLTNILGKPLQIQKARSNSITFNTNNLLPGLYFIKVMDVKGNIKTEKFVKD